MSLDPTGCFTALITPFVDDRKLDEPKLRAHCQRQVDAGIGLVPCGTTGETPTLTHGEDDRVIATAVEVADGKVPVIAGVGSNATRTAVDNTIRAKRLGADAALVATPYYNKPPQPSLLQHFEAVIEEGGLPVVLYNVPGRTGCKLTAESILELAEHPNVVGIKEASADMELFHTLVNYAPEGFRVLSGDDAWTLPVMLLGGHGVVSVTSNVVPRQMNALVEAAQEGDLQQARALQKRLLPLFRALFMTTNPIPVKRAANMLGMCGPWMRRPLTRDAMDEEMVARLKAVLDDVVPFEAEA
ncbi:MAG: 4-hydroxy-tetrahydrodipicolinate synthase [Myxococcota bacterium]